MSTTPKTLPALEGGSAGARVFLPVDVSRTIRGSLRFLADLNVPVAVVVAGRVFRRDPATGEVVETLPPGALPGLSLARSQQALHALQPGVEVVKTALQGLLELLDGLEDSVHVSEGRLRGNRAGGGQEVPPAPRGFRRSNAGARSRRRSTGTRRGSCQSGASAKHQIRKGQR